MASTEEILPEGDRIRKAVQWVCETLSLYPEKKRSVVVKEAELKFDLTPKECLLLDKKLDSGN